MLEWVSEISAFCGQLGREKKEAAQEGAAGGAGEGPANGVQRRPKTVLG